MLNTQLLIISEELFHELEVESVTMESSVNLVNFDWNILLTAINLVIMYLLLRKFLFKPIMKTIDKRKEIIDKQFKDASDAEEEAQKHKADYESKLQSVEMESSGLIKQAKDNAKVEYDRIVGDADDKSKKLVKDAKKQIELEYNRTMKTVKTDSAKLVMSAAKKVIGQEVEINNSRIYDDFIMASEKDKAVISLATEIQNLSLSEDEIEEAKAIFKESEELSSILSNPAVDEAAKERAIKKIFDGPISEFVIRICKLGYIEEIFDIFNAYEDLYEKIEGIVKAKIICVEPPSEAQKEKICEYVKRKFGANDVDLEIEVDESLSGGFILRVGDVEFDHSLKGMLDELWNKLVGEVK